MKYIINPAGNRIVDATPKETYSLRPSIAACFRSRRVSEGDIEDFCQEVEIVAWKAIEDQRIVGNAFSRPVDALLKFMFAVAWNLWRNHYRKLSVRNEALVDELPEMIGPSPDGRLDARETLLHLSTHPEIIRILLEAVNVPTSLRYTNVAKSTHFSRLTYARSVARNIALGRYREPRQPIPPTPKTRKKQR
jgi:hypothetical protein